MQFKDIPGHLQIKQILLKSARSGRIPHNQLFIERKGGTALALALAYAQLLNCENIAENDSCGICPACIKMSKYIHPDVHFTYPVVTKKKGKVPLSTDYIEEWRSMLNTTPYFNYDQWMKTIGAENKQGNITALECRQIIKNFGLKKVEGKMKVLILWMPEFLGKEGNILLKLLEEPTDDTVFLLVAVDESKILKTIISRSQQITLPPLEDEDIRTHLAKEGVEVEKCGRITFLADGDLIRALSLISEEDNENERLFRDWMRYLVKDRVQLIQFIDKELNDLGRVRQKNLVLYGLHLFRECLILNGSGLKGRLIKEDAALAEWLYKNLGNEGLNETVDLFNKLHYHIERNANPRLQFLHVSLELEKLLKRSRKKASNIVA